MTRSYEHWTPTEAQQLALDWLDKDEALLFMGCGLGKTSTVLAKLAKLKQAGNLKGALILAPLRVTQLVWEQDNAKFGFGLNMVSLRDYPEALGLADVYLLNYDRIDRLKDIHKYVDTVVFDEVTKLKSTDTIRFKTLYKLLYNVDTKMVLQPNGKRKKVEHITRKVERKWGLTGTPQPNSEMDLFGQVVITDGGRRFSRHITHFRTRFFSLGYDGWTYNITPYGKQEIPRLLSDISISLPSSKYLDIPDTIEEVVEIKLPAHARDAYDQMEKQFVANLLTGVVTAGNAMVQAGKLLQLTSGCIYDENRDTHEVHTAKIEAISKMVDPKRPLLVAYGYRSELEALKGIGAVDFKELKSLDDWDAGKIPLMAIHPDSAGHGLNLQVGGSRLVFSTLPFSREKYDQTIARIARRGQGEVTEVTLLLATKTIDEKVYLRLQHRGESQQNLLNFLFEQYGQTKKKD